MTFPPLHVSSSFGELRDAKEFSDVTLACEDDELMEGHKVILAPVNKEQSTMWWGLSFIQVELWEVCHIATTYLM